MKTIIILIITGALLATFTEVHADSNSQDRYDCEVRLNENVPVITKTFKEKNTPRERLLSKNLLNPSLYSENNPSPLSLAQETTYGNSTFALYVKKFTQTNKFKLWVNSNGEDFQVLQSKDGSTPQTMLIIGHPSHDPRNPVGTLNAILLGGIESGKLVLLPAIHSQEYATYDQVGSSNQSVEISLPLGIDSFETLVTLQTPKTHQIPGSSGYILAEAKISCVKISE